MQYRFTVPNISPPTFPSIIKVSYKNTSNITNSITTFDFAYLQNLYFTNSKYDEVAGSTVCCNSLAQEMKRISANGGDTLTVAIQAQSTVDHPYSVEYFQIVASESENAPTTTEVTPLKLPLDGEAVTLTGTNLNTVDSVNIGNVSAPITSSTATSLTIEAPAMSAGSHTLTYNAPGRANVVVATLTYGAVPSAPSLPPEFNSNIPFGPIAIALNIDAGS